MVNRPPDVDDRYEKRAAEVAGHEYVLDRAEVDVRVDYQVGRPRRHQSPSATKPLAVRLTDADRERLEDYAQRTGRPMSSVVRAPIA